VGLRDLLQTLTSKAHRSPPAVALQRVCFTMVFEKCDPEETGEISEASFQRLMAIHGVNKNAAVEVFRKVDHDRSGVMTFEELARILAMERDATTSMRAVKTAILKEAFMLMDLDDSRELTKAELTQALKKWHVNPEDVTKMWKKLDHDGDGQISWPEFTRALVFWATPVNDPRPAMSLKYALSKMLFREVASEVSGMTEAELHSRQISEDTFVGYLAVIGTTRDDARRIFKHLDKDSSGTLGWDEFSHAFSVDVLGDGVPESVKVAWNGVKKKLWGRILDVLGFSAASNIGIGFEEFKDTLVAHGVSKADCEYCFRWLDTDQSGDVTWSEFNDRLCPQ
jgi:Ca2+-binding EF-hand superfamily protein